MGRSRKLLTLCAVLACLVVIAQTAKAQRALLPSQAETAGQVAIEEDLPVAVVEKITKMVRNHASLANLKVEVRVGKTRQKLGQCPQELETALSGRDRPWGAFSVLVRCPQPFWAVSVPVQTRVFGPQVVSTQYLPPGERLKPDQLQVITTDITRSPPDRADSLSQVIGRALNRPVPQGGVVTLNILKADAVIKVGEVVRVQIQGRGFSAMGEGKAISAGSIGDSIRVRMTDGQQVTGQVVRAGLVEVMLQ